jgi:hypothetical protein
MIKKAKWGIELLRDGDRFNEHAARFSSDGSYGQWIANGDLSQFIVLDFCRKLPDSPWDRRSPPSLVNIEV